MKRTTQLTTWGLLATLAATTLTPVFADSAGGQNNKNTWRNLGVAGAVIAGYGLLKGNQTATVLGAAGGAYAANRYETDRRHQSQDNSYNNYNYDNRGNYNRGSNDNRRYHRTGGWQPPAVNHNDYRDNNGGDNWNRNDNTDDRESNDDRDSNGRNNREDNRSRGGQGHRGGRERD